MLTVALVGADGAGKSTVTRLVARRLTVPSAVVYMGVNLEASGVMLPSTRLALAVKRRLGRRPDMVASPAETRGPTRGRRGIAWSIRETLRITNWMAEEWFRQLVAWRHLRRGRVVIFDRHFLADQHAHDVAGPSAGRPAIHRLHGLMLRRLYPKPDLVVVLDAPAELLHARKPESTVEYLDQRRREYLSLGGSVPRLAVVDATQPLERVVADVTELIEREFEDRRSRAAE